MHLWLKKIGFWSKNFLILKDYGAKKVNKGISYKGLEEDTTGQFVKQLRDTGLAEYKAGSSWPRTAHTDANINLVDKLVLSQEDAPQSCNIVIYLRQM